MRMVTVLRALFAANNRYLNASARFSKPQFVTTAIFQRSKSEGIISKGVTGRCRVIHPAFGFANLHETPLSRISTARISSGSRESGLNRSRRIFCDVRTRFVDLWLEKSKNYWCGALGLIFLKVKIFQVKKKLTEIWRKNIEIVCNLKNWTASFVGLLNLIFWGFFIWGWPF